MNLRFALTLFVFVLTANALAAPTAEHREQLRDMWETLKEAGQLYRDGKGRDAARLVEDVQKQFSQFKDTDDKQTQQLLQRIYKSLSSAHVALQLDGIRLPPLAKRTFGDPAVERPDQPDPPPDSPDNPPPPSANAVSFAGDVAPILLGKCGRCHVNDSKGRLNMGTFAGLMRGSEAGRIVFAGDAAGSTLIEVIEAGDMPRGGAKVSPAQLETLKKWIAQGAKNDGPGPDTPLSRLTRVVPEETPDAPMVDVVRGGDTDGISFGRDVAGVLASKCNGCHGTNRPRNNFSLANFQRLLAGGDSGPPVVPGKPADSLLIKKLKGQSGQRMPLNQPPLPAATIAKIEEWIAKGAKFDGPNATAPLERVAAVVRAGRATHEQLSAERQQIAERNWKLSLPDVDPKSKSTKNFLLLGNLGQAALDQLAESAEGVAPRVGQLLKVPADQPLIKGRLTLFAFDIRYDYSEFGRMVEQRKLPPAWRGHWNYDAVDAYGCLLPSDKYSSEALIAEQLAGVYVASLGDVPSWFSSGAGRAVAAKIAPDDSRVQAWDDGLTEALGLMKKPDDFISGELPSESAALAGYSFAAYLMKDSTKFQRLLSAVKEGTEFDKAFATAYGSTPNQATSKWVQSVAKRRGR